MGLQADKPARLARDALHRGQTAADAGDKAEALRWLERAHRLAPVDGTILLLWASALLGVDNVKAAALFDRVLATADVRDAWLGLATARLLRQDRDGARAAVAEALSRHAVWSDLARLADGIAEDTGWCGVSGGRVLIRSRAAAVPVSRLDATELPMAGWPSGGPEPFALALPPNWTAAHCLSVTVNGVALLGSPVSLATIARVEGAVERGPDAVRGWAWHPNDPDTDPVLSIGVGKSWREIVATAPADPVPGLVPLARPRGFVIPTSPDGKPIRVRGRDGRALAAGPRHVAEPVAASAGPARWPDAEGDSVILITHDDGGGVERRVRDAVAAHTAMGRRAIVLRPTADEPAGVVVQAPPLPALRFQLPGQLASLTRLLRRQRPVAMELHHFLNHDPAILDLPRALAVPYEAHIHDYIWFCARIGLVGRGDRYCREPPPASCETCVAREGSYLRETISVAALLERSRAVLSGARRIVAPSRDAAARIARHFPGLSPVVVPHEDDAALEEPPPIRNVSGPVRVCVAGAIGLHKGFRILLGCARDAKRRGLDLDFVVVGTTIDDDTLMKTGKVFVTGPYQPDEAVALVQAQHAALALLPSIWPETWCLGLTELWRAGLRVAAFDIGAPAERIRATGRGFLLPLGLSCASLNDALLNAARGRIFTSDPPRLGLQPCALQP